VSKLAGRTRVQLIFSPRLCKSPLPKVFAHRCMVDISSKIDFVIVQALHSWLISSMDGQLHRHATLVENE